MTKDLQLAARFYRTADLNTHWIRKSAPVTLCRSGSPNQTARKRTFSEPALRHFQTLILGRNADLHVHAYLGPPSEARTVNGASSCGLKSKCRDSARGMTQDSFFESRGPALY